MKTSDRVFYLVLYVGIPALFIGGMILIGVVNGWR